MSEEQRPTGGAASPPDIASIFAAAVRSHQSGATGEAERLYRQVLALNPDHVQCLYYLGIVQMQIGRPDPAIELFDRAIELNGGNPEYRYNAGVAYQLLGRTAEAVAQYRKAIAIKPDHAEAHMNLGNALKEQGKLAEATECYKRVIGLKPDVAAAHYNLANVIAAFGRNDEALAHYQRALALNPDFPEVHNNLGNVLLAQDKVDDAAAHFERALALNPRLVAAHVGRGNVQRERGDADGAAEHYRRALALNPDDADAHNNLGTLLLAQGNPDGAEEHYQHALKARPDLAEAHNNLGIVLMAEGKPEEASARYRQALILKPEFTEAHNNLARALMAEGKTGQALATLVQVIDASRAQESKTLFVQCVRTIAAGPDVGKLRDVVTRSLTEHWGRPSDLAWIATTLIKANDALVACIRRAADVRAIAGGMKTELADFTAIYADPLLRRLLVSVPIADVELERVLIAIRRYVLESATNGTAIDDDVLAFAAALAQQCFINEYVFALDDEEIAYAEQLRDALVEALASGVDIAPLQVIAVASYFALYTLPGALALLDRTYVADVADVLSQQIREPREEAKLTHSLACLTAVEDEVSLKVREQYEENPYPRWVHAAPAGTPMPIDQHLRAKFPHAFFRPLNKRSLDLLIAGCGTGQHAIETTRQFAGAKTLAIDLSRKSLAYAMRKTRELQLTNIDYAQADILELGSIERTFDVIEASGVLHHMADPLAGWRVLLDRLRPGGFMALGFYSEIARRDIVTVRTFIASRGYRPTANDIRRCRQELIGWTDGTPVKNVTASVDFFSTSGCRDLLFHVQEHRLTLPQISAFLAEHDLEFLGFEIDTAGLQRYRKTFPQDKAMTDLALWHDFETDNPSTFAGMYQFWVQKRV